MIFISSEGKVNLTFTDKEMSALLSALAVATIKWNKIKDKEVTTTKDDLEKLSISIFEQLREK